MTSTAHANHPDNIKALADAIVAHCGDDLDVDLLTAFQTVAPFLETWDRHDLADMLDICPVHECDVFICLDDNADCVGDHGDCGCDLEVEA